MGHFFNISDLQEVFKQAGDDLVNELGRPCRLVYPPRMVACANCIWNEVNQRSTNTWKTGGPIPFADGVVCPLCGGRGRRAEEVSETISLLVVWEPRQFTRPFSQVELRVPYGIVQTKGFLTDLPKIQRCDHLELSPPSEGYGKRPYKLLGEPGDPSNVVPARWLICWWERAG